MSYREPPPGFDFDELRDAVSAAYKLGGEEAAARVLRFFRVPVPCPRCVGSADDPEWRVPGKNPDLSPTGENWGVPALCHQCGGLGAVERRDNPACRWKLWGVAIRLAETGKKPARTG